MQVIESFLAREEGKTLEFKENCRPLGRIVETAVAFANTAGGTIVIGVRDQTEEVVGIPQALDDQERLANALADGIHPLLIPDIQIHRWRERELIAVSVPHAVGPYYVRSQGRKAGVYIRLGSTNRQAGPEMIAELERLARNVSFDEQPCSEVNSEDIDFRVASEFFAALSRPLSEPKRRSLNFVSLYSTSSG